MEKRVAHKPSYPGHVPIRSIWVQIRAFKDKDSAFKFAKLQRTKVSNIFDYEFQVATYQRVENVE